MKQCTCKDWKINTPILDAPYTMNLTSVGEYTGKIFNFCPWCGKALITITKSTQECTCFLPYKQTSAGCSIHGVNYK